MTLSVFGHLAQNYNDLIFSFSPLFWFPLKKKSKTSKFVKNTPLRVVFQLAAPCLETLSNTACRV